MTKEEILNHFSYKPVYKFEGTVEDMRLLLESSNNSYGYIIVEDVIYVCPTDPINDQRVIEIKRD